MRAPRSASPADPAVAVSLHDVAPQTWVACRRVLAAIAEVAPVPVTLLVVPDYHGEGLRRTTPRYLHELRDCLDRGDELALHGWKHLDELPVPRWPLEWLRRTQLTRREGEFAALDTSGARQRIEAGLSWFDANAFPVFGFVPPAWLLGDAARQALRGFAFRYTTSFSRLHLLPEDVAIEAPALVYSARTRVRRAISKRVVDLRARRLDRHHFVRLALHPVDAHPELLGHWQRLLAWVLTRRQAITKLQMAEFARVRYQVTGYR